MTENYQCCTRCVMDTSAPEITFDQDGVCSFCALYKEREKNELRLDSAGQEKLDYFISKLHNTGGQYNCLIGLSGGVDSSYVAHLVKNYNLRPLAIHFDNGWNSELSVANIERIVKKLDIPYLSYVMDWDQFKDLQRSYLLASVINAEIPTDHAIFALLLQTAFKYNIKTIITGSNITTEGIMPRSWCYDARDWTNVKDIHQHFGKQRLEHYPHVTLSTIINTFLIKKLQFFNILNYVPFVKNDVINLMTEEYGWREYGGKHYESVFTRFYQSQLLPQKFGVDKRRAHYATLINSKQMSRDNALQSLSESPIDSALAEQDLEFIKKKLDFTDQEFNEILSAKPIPHEHYKNKAWLFMKSPNLLRNIKKYLMAH